MIDPRAARTKPKPKLKSLYSQFLDWKNSKKKYQPHQGKRELARRLRQMARAVKALELQAIKRACECWHCACYQLGGGCCYCERYRDRCVEM